MIGVFWYLTQRTFANRIRYQLRRLRQPRYALAMLLGVLYLWYFLFRPRSAHSGGSALLLGTPGFALIASIGLALMVSTWWLLGGDRGALAFTPAEVQYLFAAPVTRRGLIRFKLLRAQPQLFISILIWLVILGPGRHGVLSLLFRLLALWVIFSTLFLHRLGASLVRANAAEHGAAGARRSWPAIVIVGGGLLALVVSIAVAAPELRAALGQGTFRQTVEQVMSGPVPHAVLYPFHLLLQPLFATAGASGAGAAQLAGGASTAARWGLAMLPALALLAAHYLWVMSSDAAFEDAAVAASARRAQRIAELRARRTAPKAATRVRGGRVKIPLAPTGMPALAIVWKNAISLLRTFTRGAAVGLGMMVVLICVMIALNPGARSGGAAVLVALLALLVAAVLVTMGPLWVRSDLRQDLPKLALLRSYPLSGTAIVVSEIASSVAALSLAQIALLVVAYIATLGVQTLPVSLGQRSVALLLLAVGLPAVNAVTLTIQNGAALLFPGWVRLGPTAGGGIEAIGQMMLTTFTTLLLLVLSWAVPALLGTVVAALLWQSWHFAGLIPAILVTVAALGVELWFLVRWLGGVFDRTDPTVLETA